MVDLRKRLDDSFDVPDNGRFIHPNEGATFFVSPTIVLFIANKHRLELFVLVTDLLEKRRINRRRR